jgi:hypothetical protein
VQRASTRHSAGLELDDDPLAPAQDGALQWEVSLVGSTWRWFGAGEAVRILEKPRAVTRAVTGVVTGVVTGLDLSPSACDQVGHDL